VMTFQLQAFYVQPITRVSESNINTNAKLSDALLQSLENLSVNQQYQTHQQYSSAQQPQIQNLDVQSSNRITDMTKKISRLENMIEKFQSSQFEQQKLMDLQQRKIVQERVKKSLAMSYQSKIQEQELKKKSIKKSEQQLKLQQEQAERFCFNADCKFFDVGAELKRDIPESIKLYEKSASLKNSKAMMALGQIYEQGSGGTP
jgi:TPR repeat protein